MITFKQAGDEAPGAFQALINRQPIGFWLQAETAKEAEEQLIELAGKAETAEQDNKALVSGAQIKLKAAEIAMRNVSENSEKLKAENELLEVKVRQLEEAIQQMKTAAQKPEKKSIWRRKR